MASLGLLHFQQLLRSFGFFARGDVEHHHAALRHEAQCTALCHAFQPQPELRAVCLGDDDIARAQATLLRHLAEMKIERVARLRGEKPCQYGANQELAVRCKQRGGRQVCFLG